MINPRGNCSNLDNWDKGRSRRIRHNDPTYKIGLDALNIGDVVEKFKFRHVNYKVKSYKLKTLWDSVLTEYLFSLCMIDRTLDCTTINLLFSLLCKRHITEAEPLFTAKSLKNGMKIIFHRNLFSRKRT